jgi:tetratricopeptide (TPR) repeat protein
MTKRLSRADWVIVSEALGIPPDEIGTSTPLNTITAQLYSGDVFEAGDPSHSLFILCPTKSPSHQYATLRASPIPGADDVVIEYVSEGLIGEDEFLARSADDEFPERHLTCSVNNDTRLATIPYILLLALSPVLRSRIERHLSRHAFQHRQLITQKLAITRVSDGQGQLAYAIARMAEEVGTRQGGGYFLNTNLSQSTLAKEVGLTRESVNAILAEWERSGLTEFQNGSLRIPDMERLRRLVELHIAPSHMTLKRIISQIDKLIARGEFARARNTCLDALRRFPDQPQLHQRAFVASARSGAQSEARTFLHPYAKAAASEATLRSVVTTGLVSGSKGKRSARNADVEDYLEKTLQPDDDPQQHRIWFQEEVSHTSAKLMAAMGRAAKEEAQALDDKALQAEKLATAAQYYARSFEMAPEAYAGVNTASLLLAANRKDEAQKYAREVMKLSGRRTDYWSIASRAESLIVLGRNQDATKEYAKAFEAQDCTPGNLATTRAQLHTMERLLDLADGQLALLAPQYTICCFSGHLPDNREENTDIHRRTSDSLISQFQSKVTCAGFGACAAGADILFSSSLLVAKADLHLVLPFSVSDFLDRSVHPFGEYWSRRAIEEVLPAARTLRVSQGERSSRATKEEVEERIWFSNRRSMGLCKLAAASLDAEAFAAALYDNGPVASVAGTAMFIRDAEEAGLTVQRHSWPTPRKTAGPTLRGTSLKPQFHRAVVFLRADMSPASRMDADSMQRVLASLGEDHPIEFDAPLIERQPNRAAHAFVFARCSDALEFGSILANRELAKDIYPSVTCDFGAARSRDGLFDMSAIKRMGAADAYLATPPRVVSCTEAIAAEASLSRSQAFEFSPMGRTESGSGTQVLRPSVSLFSARKRA